MIVALIAALAVAAAAIGGLITVAVYWRSAVTGERAALAVEGIANRAQLLAERERDHAVAGRVQAEAERDGAQQQLAETQALVNRNAKEAVEHVRSRIEAGTATDAVDALNGILSRDIVPVVAAVEPAADREGHAESTDLHAPKLAGEDEVRRLPEP